MCPDDLRPEIATLLAESLVNVGCSLEGAMVLRSFKVSIIGHSSMSSLANIIAQTFSQTAMDSKAASHVTTLPHQLLSRQLVHLP